MPINILVAEDNDINRIMIRKIFQKTGINFDMAANGEEAIKAFENKYYDLVFMDIEMPFLDGFEVTRKLREKYKNQSSQPFIVALTANSLSGEKNRCLEQGMNEYLAKPFSVEDVHTMIEKANEAYANPEKN